MPLLKTLVLLVSLNAQSKGLFGYNVSEHGELLPFLDASLTPLAHEFLTGEDRLDPGVDPLVVIPLKLVVKNR